MPKKTYVSAIIPLVLLLASTGLGQSSAPVDLTLRAITQAGRLNDIEFSPDGQTIAFVSNHSGAAKIWLIPTKGGEPKTLLPSGAGEGSPEWSPDGKRIAYLSGRGGAQEIFVADINGGAPQQITSDGSGKHALRFSPDGKQIAYIGNLAKTQDIYIVNAAAGSQAKQLTQKTNEWDENRWAPAWSPDSKHIAFVSNRSEYYADDLWMIDTDGTHLRKITTNVRVMTNPIWSPDGKYIAFNAVHGWEFWFDDASDFYVVEMPNKIVRKIDTDGFATDLNGGLHMYWGADSRTLYYRYNVRGNTNVWAIHVEGPSLATQITNGEGVIHAMSLSGKSDMLAFVRSTQLSPGELTVMPLGGGEETALTNWAKTYKGVAAPTKVSFLSRNGLYINGYLYRPAVEPGKKYPALVSVHGGGNNAYANGFHPLEQYLATKGYLVLAIEYRGSSGYGRDFQLASWGSWANEQGWDAVAASDFLRSLKECSGKVGIFGGSYGGIMTMAAVTKDSSKFQAAAPFYGIYDWANAYKDGDRLMKFWIIMGMKGAKPDENPELYYKDSTVNFVDKVTTPLLIEHGELDRRAPYPQAQELVDALKKNKKVFEYFHFPDEHHGVRRPDNYVNAYTRMEAWFDKYLKDEAGAEAKSGGAR